MANRDYSDTTLDMMIRQIVRQELRVMFTRADNFTHPQLSIANSQDRDRNSVVLSSVKDRVRKHSNQQKGKVTDPSKDRRLKANRDKNT